MRIRIWLICIALLYPNHSVNSQKSIYTITNGSLLSNSSFNFSIFAKQLKGVVLYCFDSKKNQMGILVQENNNKNIIGMELIIKNNIRFNFNDQQTEIELIKLCGCDPCNNTTIQFLVKVDKSFVNVKCNKRNVTKLSLKLNPTLKGKHNLTYPIPASLLNKHNSMYIIIGNIGPYIVNSTYTQLPLKSNFIGCLSYFEMDNNLLKFISTNIKDRQQMAPFCCNNSIDNICNNRTCLEIRDGVIKCDCSGTALSGLYCDSKLRPYFAGIGTSHYLAEDGNNAYLKMTWRSSSDHDNCLLEIMNGDKIPLLTITNNQLLFQSSVTTNVTTKELHFINLNISNNNLYIKINNTQSIPTFSLNNGTNLNNRFAENRNFCRLFEGRYDVVNDTEKTNLGSTKSTESYFGYSSTKRMLYSNYVALTSTNNVASTSVKSHWWISPYNSNIIWLFIFVIGFFTIMPIILIAIYLKYSYSMKKRLEKLKNVSMLAKSQGNVVITEIGVYGRVNDEGNYGVYGQVQDGSDVRVYGQVEDQCEYDVFGIVQDNGEVGVYGKIEDHSEYEYIVLRDIN